MTDTLSHFTALLKAHQAGSPCAQNQLFDLAYRDMKAIAANLLRNEHRSITLQPTSLVHEAYIKLTDQNVLINRPHFFAVVATIMRRILVDSARRRLSAKRGSGLEEDPILDSIQLPVAQNASDLVEINDLIEKLAEKDSRAASICELRFFVGLELEEIAENLDVSLATVKRDLSFAKAWLKTQI